MTVIELMRKLAKYEQTRVVVLAKDAEGNGYRALASMDPCAGGDCDFASSDQDALVLWPED